MGPSACMLTEESFFDASAKEYNLLKYELFHNLARDLLHGQ